jgi:hypothetical protein
LRDLRQNIASEALRDRLARDLEHIITQAPSEKAGPATVFDLGEWKIEVASRKNADGTVSFVTIGAGLIGIDFVVGKSAAGKPTLTVRDAQHEYVFDAQ